MPPPPPPPPGPPPPPPPPVVLAAPPKSVDRGDLLNSIQKGARLKKVNMNDRSAPASSSPSFPSVAALDANTSLPDVKSSAAARSSENSAVSSSNSNTSKPALGGPPGLGALFAGGVPKLRSTSRSNNALARDVGPTPTPYSSRPPLQSRPAAPLPPQLPKRSPPASPPSLNSPIAPRRLSNLAAAPQLPFRAQASPPPKPPVRGPPPPPPPRPASLSPTQSPLNASPLLGSLSPYTRPPPPPPTSRTAPPPPPPARSRVSSSDSRDRLNELPVASGYLNGSSGQTPVIRTEMSGRWSFQTDLPLPRPFNSRNGLLTSPLPHSIAQRVVQDSSNFVDLGSWVKDTHVCLDKELQRRIERQEFMKCAEIKHLKEQVEALRKNPSADEHRRLQNELRRIAT